MNTLREIFDRHAHETDNWNNDLSFEGFKQAIADYEASKWKTGYPDLIEGKHYSKNVLAEVEDFTDLQVMNAFVLRHEGEKIMKWARVYDGLNGDGEFDDNYNVIRWTEIPTPPTK